MSFSALLAGKDHNFLGLVLNKETEIIIITIISW
jgi:hypothetical protein